MKLATTTSDFNAYTKSKEESVQYICEAGFRYLDYDFGMDYHTRGGAYADDWREFLANLKLYAESLGAKFIQAHSPMGAPIAPDNAAFIADTARCVEACGILGIPNLVVHSGYTKGLTKEQTFEANAHFYEPLLKLAKECNVNILVENFNKMCIDGLYWIDNAPDLLAMIETVDHPNFHAVWDAGHGNMQDMPQHESLKILGHHVYALHVQDNWGNDDHHLMPFSGSLNLDSLMHGLIDIGYQGYFTFESGNVFYPAGKRRPYTEDTRLSRPPLRLRRTAEKYLYEIGKCILEEYGCYEI